MAVCSLGHRFVFSKDYDNLVWKGYDRDEIIGMVECLLEEQRPELIWRPYTSEMCVEHFSLRIAKEENDIEEIAAFMKNLWEQAKSEYRATVSNEKAELMLKAEKAVNFAETCYYLEKMNELVG